MWTTSQRPQRRASCTRSPATRPHPGGPMQSPDESGRGLHLVQDTDESYPMLTTPFHDLDEYERTPRISGLVLSPDGSRRGTQVATLNRDVTKTHTALWEVYPSRAEPPPRLARSALGESGAA